jgi:hypothetical protein
MTESKIALRAPTEPEMEEFEFVVTPELNQQYLYAEEDFHPRYIEETEDGPPIIHPALLLNRSNSSKRPSYSVEPGAGGLHTGEQTFFLNPARIGKKLKVTWKLMGTYEKRGRPYTCIEIRIVDEDGLEILRRIHHSTIATKEFESQKKR